MTRDEVLDAIYDEVTKHDTCIEDSVVSLLEEIVRLREQLRDTHTEVFHLGEKMAVIEQERDQFASMLHDCENERDGWKHRAERAERVVEAAKAYLTEWDSDSYESVAHAALLDAVRALDAEAQP